MAEIKITTQPVGEVVAVGGTPTPLTVVATYDGEETLLYAWYVSDDATGADAKAIAGATTDTLTLTDLKPGEVLYYYCELSAADVDGKVLTDIVAVYEMLPSITITTQPVSELLPADDPSPTAKTVVVSYDGEEELKYQWYECTDESGANATTISGATTDTLTLGTWRPAYLKWYYCVISADDVQDSVTTDIVYQNMLGALPQLPNYITPQFINSYVAQCTMDIQQRFIQEQGRTGIVINSELTRAAYSAEIELFMSVI